MRGRKTIKIAAVYAVAASLYIVLTSLLIARLVGQQWSIAAQLAQGLVFVAATTGAIWYLLRKASKSRRRLHEALEELNRANLLVKAQSQKLLQQSESRFERLVESMQACVWTADVADAFALTYINSWGEKMFGHRLRDYRKKRNLWLNMVHRDDREYCLSRLPLLYAMGHNDLELRIVTATGEEKWIAIKAWITYGQNRQPERIEGLAIDITRIKHAELAKEQMVKDMSHLAHVNSHRLRKPLANILGLLSLMKQITTEEQETPMRMLEAAAQELDLMVHEMNELFARRQQSLQKAIAS